MTLELGQSLSRRVTVVPANRASWDDLQTVFGTRGYAARCQCQRFKIGNIDWSSGARGERGTRLREETACGHPRAGRTSGLVAYVTGEPVGWCAVEPRVVYRRLLRTRGWRKGRDEDPADDRVWAITCFITRAGYRRRGITYALAAAAIDFARSRGARAIEGYPMITRPDRDITWGELNVGSRNVFADAGFIEVSRPSLRRVVMRIDFQPDRSKSNTRSDMTETPANSAPIILVPGFWLGAWAWDEVAGALRADGHDVTAITLPGLESADADRSSITFQDHVDAIVAAVEAAPAPAVLAVHSATGFSGYAASDRVPERIAAMVYVDTAPGKGALDPDFKDVEKPMVWKEIEEEENLDGLSEEQKETFRQRAVPVPGSLIRESVELTNDARRDIPSTLICTGFTAEQYQTYAREHPDWAFLAGIPELRNPTWVDLPTSHWPMWSRPKELAGIIGDVAKAHVPRAG